ncbi:hypothetical protein G9C85_14130 [Halorubellus sp. JP-L1]|uniref:hypothetical protein n=1 Tax=Halorubellus sp. JP-L1 TaxID=2715753 RepID=UPI00140BE14C|nr:hypothetical protein [Halorubellus sp. JP-L1]NHN42760.1 hypothetical protein [Halorubellus sp. JP-L1]
MTDGSESDGSTSTVDDETGGIGSVLYAGVLLGIGFLFLVDSTTHLSYLYEGIVISPIGGWVRILITSILGSTFVVASLSVVLDST